MVMSGFAISNDIGNLFQMTSTWSQQRAEAQSDAAKNLFYRQRAKITPYGYALLVRQLLRSFLMIFVQGLEEKTFCFVFFLQAIPATTFVLGCWQVKRRTWKLNLIDDLARKVHSHPIDLPTESVSLPHFASVDFLKSFYHVQ
jgi:surfeit locus 1 family protein